VQMNDIMQSLDQLLQDYAVDAIQDYIEWRVEREETEIASQQMQQLERMVVDDNLLSPPEILVRVTKAVEDTIKRNSLGFVEGTIQEIMTMPYDRALNTSAVIGLVREDDYLAPHVYFIYQHRSILLPCLNVEDEK
jgi:hypothetical protein